MNLIRGFILLERKIDHCVLKIIYSQ